MTWCQLDPITTTGAGRRASIVLRCERFVIARPPNRRSRRSNELIANGLLWLDAEIALYQNAGLEGPASQSCRRLRAFLTAGAGRSVGAEQHPGPARIQARPLLSRADRPCVQDDPVVGLRQALRHTS